MRLTLRDPFPVLRPDAALRCDCAVDVLREPDAGRRCDDTEDVLREPEEAEGRPAPACDCLCPDTCLRVRDCAFL